MGLNGRAVALQREGKAWQALPLAERALAIHKEVLGQSHPDYARSLNNLGMLHHMMGGHKAALPLQERALAIRKDVLGQKHPDYAGLSKILCQGEESRSGHVTC